MSEDTNPAKIIRGCWQLATGHAKQIVGTQPILHALDSGFNTFDCADIYLGVEALLGVARKAAPNKKIRIHTKFVPDLDRLPSIDRRYIESIIDRSLKRLQVERLDLVQFHWWDWNVKNYGFTMQVLSDLAAKGKIDQIGLTNVNREYLEEFSKHFAIASIQTQVSLFDRRIERGLSRFCQQKNIKIFAYGLLLGGFVSEKWLGQPEPLLGQLANRSLVKYKLLIDSACGWAEFQARLLQLSDLAKQYQCDMANIAITAVLQQNRANAVIVGLSPQNFATQNRRLANLPLLAETDLQKLNAWTCHIPGDVYEAERDMAGAHAKIMKYNLNTR